MSAKFFFNSITLLAKLIEVVDYYERAIEKISDLIVMSTYVDATNPANIKYFEGETSLV